MRRPVCRRRRRRATATPRSTASGRHRPTTATSAGRPRPSPRRRAERRSSAAARRRVATVRRGRAARARLRIGPCPALPRCPSAQAQLAAHRGHVRRASPCARPATAVGPQVAVLVVAPAQNAAVWPSTSVLPLPARAALIADALLPVLAGARERFVAHVQRLAELGRDVGPAAPASLARRVDERVAVGAGACASSAARRRTSTPCRLAPESAHPQRRQRSAPRSSRRPPPAPPRRAGLGSDARWHSFAGFNGFAKDSGAAPPNFYSRKRTAALAAGALSHSASLAKRLRRRLIGTIRGCRPRQTAATPLSDARDARWHANSGGMP